MSCPACAASELSPREIYFLGFTSGSLGTLLVRDPVRLRSPEESMIKLLELFCEDCRDELDRQAMKRMQEVAAREIGAHAQPG